MIDFKSFVYCLARINNDFICGGRHRIIQQSWKETLKVLKSTGCELVFFSDWFMSETKMEKWMERQNQQFERCVKFYNAVDRIKLYTKIIKEIGDMKPPNSTLYDLELISQDYGELYYSIDRENDIKLAQYAKRNDAFAVISNDSDFLIFEGNWSLFSIHGIREDSLIRVKTHQKKCLHQRLDLTREEMPLFATVLGNDFFTEKLFESIDDAADFARNKSSLSTDEIISQLPNRNIDLEKFQNSLDSYKIDFDDAPIDDPYEKTFRENGHKMYRFYKVLLGPVHGISLPYYDMKENDPVVTLPELIIRWTRHKIGILHDHKHKTGESHTFSVIAKKKVDEPFLCHKYTPKYPNNEDCKSTVLFKA